MMDEYIKSLLSSDPESISAIRACCLLWSIGVLIVWIIISISKFSIQPVDSSVASIIMGLAVAKVGQKYVETNNRLKDEDKPNRDANAK